MKRMQHPQHGFHVPINSLEREEMLKHGWTDEPEVPTEREPTEVKRKPGRPRKEQQ